jgi:hypothetical protein
MNRSVFFFFLMSTLGLAADVRAPTPTLVDGSGAGAVLSKSQAGDSASGKVGNTVYTFTDSSGNLVFPQLNAGGNLPVTFSNTSIIANAGTNLNTSALALDSNLTLFKNANHTDLVLIDTDLLAFKSANHTDLIGTQPRNITQFGGTNLSTGVGASGSGIPRVTVSNDSTVGLNAGSNLVGKVGIDQTTPGTTNGVVVNSSALPTGAATATNQSTEITALGTINTTLGTTLPRNVSQIGGNSINTGTGASGTGTQRVAVASDSSITVNASSNIIGNVRVDQTTPGTTNGVVVNSSALPTGAATSALQTTGNTTLSTLSTQQTSGAQKTQVVDGSGNVQPSGDVLTRKIFVQPTDGSNNQGYTAANEAKVSVTQPLPAGTNIVGNVRVDQTTPGTTNGVVVNSSALPTGASTSALQTTGNNSLSSIDGKFVASSIDANNSTTSQLTGAAVYVGTFTNALQWPCVGVSVVSDQISATNGLQVEWSWNGTTVQDQDNYSISAANGQQFTFGRKWPYYRIRYTNGATTTTTFTLGAVLSQTCPVPSTHRTGDGVNTEQDGQLVIQVPGRMSLTYNAPFSVSVGTSSTTFLAANTARKGFCTTNTTSATVSYGIGQTAILNSGITLFPGGVWCMDDYNFSTAQINSIASVAASVVPGQEMQ